MKKDKDNFMFVFACIYMNILIYFKTNVITNKN